MQRISLIPKAFLAMFTAKLEGNFVVSQNLERMALWHKGGSWEVGREGKGRHQERGREKRHGDSEVQAVMRMLLVH